LSGSQPKMRRSSSTRDATQAQQSLNRQSSGSYRKISSTIDPREPLAAPEWQYESARSMSRIQTSFDRSGSVYREQGVQTNLPPVAKTSRSSARNASLNRSGSLRKACSDESSDIDEDDGERAPLNPRVNQQPAQTPSSTSDYHSDEVHGHRRTNSFHGLTKTPTATQKGDQPHANPSHMKWQSFRYNPTTSRPDGQLRLHFLSQETSF
jgi:hypothetical protein